MPDYSQGKIYKIVKKDDHTQCYVGSTTRTLAQRLSCHKIDAKRRPTKFYKIIDGNWEDWEIILIENYSCNSREELEKKEKIYTLEIGTLNDKVQGRTQKEYQKQNRHKGREYEKKYRDLHKEEIKIRRLLHKINLSVGTDC